MSYAGRYETVSRVRAGAGTARVPVPSPLQRELVVIGGCGKVDNSKSFWARVAMGAVSECWLWTGSVNVQGYGQAHALRYLGERRTIGAHRLAYILAIEDPGDRHVHHECGNKLCCNPAHLRALTRREHSDLSGVRSRRLQRLAARHARYPEPALATSTKDKPPMSTSTETKIEIRQTWINDIELCHIDDGSELRSYCGEGDELTTCADYDGSAICPTCGAPNCPRCAQLSALDDALEDAR